MLPMQGYLKRFLAAIHLSLKEGGDLWQGLLNSIKSQLLTCYNPVMTLD